MHVQCTALSHIHEFGYDGPRMSANFETLKIRGLSWQFVIKLGPARFRHDTGTTVLRRSYESTTTLLRHLARSLTMCYELSRMQYDGSTNEQDASTTLRDVKAIVGTKVGIIS